MIPVGSAGKALLELLGRTWRVESIYPPAGTGRRRVLYSFWHGTQLPLLYTHRNRGITVMVSRSRDGGLVAALLSAMGFGTVRGSSSRNGAEAAMEMCSILGRGSCAITPDGPRGPAKTVKPGVLRIAARTGVPITAMGVAAWPRIRLSSWDGFLIPLPWSRVAVAEGIPILPKRITEAALTAEMGRVTAAAAMAVSPAAALQAAAAGVAGAAAMPLLLFRPSLERRERLGGGPSLATRPAWLHGSSLGELRGLLPVAGALSERRVPVYFTCFTPSGRAFIRREGLPGSFLPLDTPGCVQRFLSRVRPRCLFLAETEIWPCLLREVLHRGIPAAMVNARLSERSMKGYTLIRRLVAGCLSGFAGILARTPEDAERFRRLGVEGRVVRVAGDGKAAVAPAPPDPEWKGMLVPGVPYLVAGSTREGEEEFVLNAVKAAGIGVILAPRHSDRLPAAFSAARRLGFAPVSFQGGEGPGKCIILDVQGVLPRIYPLGAAAFLGGTVARVGGHNILEPLSQGLPVAVGPHHWNHRATVEKGVATGVVRVASDPTELASILCGWIQSPVSGDAARDLAGLENRCFHRELQALLEGMML